MDTVSVGSMLCMYSSTVTIKVAQYPGFLRSTNLESKLIGASLSEPHIDDTTGRNHICIIITRGMQGIVGRA